MERSYFLFSTSVMAKILSIVSFCIVFVVAASGIGVYQIRKVGQEIQLIAEADVPLTEALGHVTNHRLEQSLLLERMLSLRPFQNVPDKEEIAVSEAKFWELGGKIKGEFEAALDIARNATSIAQTVDQLAEFESVLTTLSTISEEQLLYSVAAQEALELIRSGRHQEADTVLKEFKDAHAEFDKDLAELLFRIQEFSQSAVDTAYAHEQNAIYLTFFISLGAAFFSFLVAVVVGQRTIAAPLEEVVDALYKLSRDDYEANLPLNRKDEIGDIGRAFHAFKDQMIEMRQHEEQEKLRQQELHSEIKLLSELNEWLQSSNSLDELFKMVTLFLTKLLPDSAGAIYVYSNSRDVLDGACSWNGAKPEAHIRPSECWGLRRGRSYVYGENVVNFACEHANVAEDDAYICLPILAHGESVGLMHLTPRDKSGSKAFLKQRRLAQMAAEQISLAIANTRMRDELHNQSIRDSLTGLYNRRHFIECLRKHIDSSKYNGHPVSLVSIDVDHFKKFNDNHGHDAGDMVLRSVGSVLEQTCDADQLPCRLGGEEFIVLLPESSEQLAIDAAEKLRQAVEAITVRYGEKNLPRITISLGVATYPTHGAMPQDLMKSADDALYASKAAGRNRVTVAVNQSDDTSDDPTSAAKLTGFEKDRHSDVSPIPDGAADKEVSEKTAA